MGIDINIKNDIKNTITIKVENDDYIEDAKNKIAAETGIPARSLRLMWENMELKDTKTFGYYEIEDSTFLNLIVKLEKSFINNDSDDSDKRIGKSSCMSCAIF